VGHVVDDEVARSILEQFCLLPDTIDEGRCSYATGSPRRGLGVHINDGSE